jgi:hypothetical protein
MGNMSNISVYLLLGRNSQKMLHEGMEIFISTGIRPKDRDYTS